MATKLRLRALTVTTSTADRTYRFASDLTVITGQVATGKSSLLMLVKYVLGGNAVLTPAVTDHVQYVTLDAALNDAPVRLRRFVAGDRTRVQLLEPGSDVPERTLSILARKDEETVSRYLLGALGIPVYQIPKSRSRQKNEVTTVGFGDVYSYCYLQAKTIDSSATGHHDSSRDVKRLTVFELLFNIIDPEVVRLKTERNALNEEIKTRQHSIRAINDFLQVSGYADRDNLRALKWRLQEELRLGVDRLDGLRNDVEVLVRRDRDQREMLSTALQNAASARENLVTAMETVRARDAALAQLRLDVAHREKALLAANLLSPFEFVTCPRCQQGLANRVVHPGECLLCRQPEPQVLDDQNDERAALLTTQIEETETLLNADRAALAKAERMSVEAETIAADMQRSYDVQTREAFSPRAQAVEAASAELEALRHGLRDVDERIATWRKLSEYEDEVTALRGQKRELDAEIRRLEQQRASQEERLSEISSLFADEVRFIGVNINGAPTIDPKTYLPKIGDSDIDALQASGGGSTTAINVAFSLALLNYAVRNPDVLLPNLLILDSPRKGIGRTEKEDQELAQRVYNRLKILAQALAGRGQMIVADNDAELSDEKGVSLIKLTLPASAVPGVPNTGVGSTVKVEDIEEPQLV